DDVFLAGAQLRLVQIHHLPGQIGNGVVVHPGKPPETLSFIRHFGRRQNSAAMLVHSHCEPCPAWMPASPLLESLVQPSGRFQKEPAEKVSQAAMSPCSKPRRNQ